MDSADHGKLAVHLAEAQEALRARDDFLAVAAHELRSPLHALALRVAMLERMAEQSGQAQLHHELKRTRRTVDRYVRRAVTLLDLSRLHAGVLRPAATWVDVDDVVRCVLDDYAEEAKFHGATLHAGVTPGLCGWWDPHMLEQIIANLVSNALKYGQGTPVHVRAYRTGAALACIEVSDGGPGIDAADRRRIFEKFERVVTRDVAGFGLGLWIVARMVAAHQGTIDVTNGPGGGALFRVVLPIGGDGPDEDRTS